MQDAAENNAEAITETERKVRITREQMIATYDQMNNLTATNTAETQKNTAETQKNTAAKTANTKAEDDRLKKEKELFDQQMKNEKEWIEYKRKTAETVNNIVFNSYQIQLNE